MAKEKIRKELVKRIEKERCSKTCDLARDCFNFRNEMKRCPKWTRTYKVVIVA